MRRFELAGRPVRFWEIESYGTTVRLRWGDAGTPGKSHDVSLASESEAVVYAERQIIAQCQRGYVELTTPPPAPLRVEVAVEQAQRFEWRHARYLEVAQEGRRLTVRGGRIVGDRDVPDRDDLRVHDLATIADASAAYDARCAEARADGGEAIEPERRHTAQAHAELEAECEASAGPDAWQVYADWLISRGDLRGEIAALENAGAHTEARRVLGAHLYELCGVDDVQLVLEYRHGFAVAASLAVDFESGEPLEDVVRAFLAAPMARFVRSLRVGRVALEEVNDWAPVVDAIAASPRGPDLRELDLDGRDGDGDLAWCRFGDLSNIGARLPALERLHVRSGEGGTFGQLELPNLRGFTREAIQMTADELRELAGARWPALEQLMIDVGSAAAGVHVDELAPILAGRGLPRLNELGLRGELAGDLIGVLARARVLPQLHALDLAEGTLAADAATELVAHAPAFRHLAALELSGNQLTEGDIERIRGALDNVICTAQREAGEDRFADVDE